MDFTLVKEGQKEPIADSGHSDFYLRSVHLEVELEAGNYIVYVGKSFFFRLRFGRKRERKRSKIFFVRFVWIGLWIVMK